MFVAEILSFAEAFRTARMSTPAFRRARIENLKEQLRIHPVPGSLHYLRTEREMQAYRAVEQGCSKDDDCISFAEIQDQ